MMNGKSVTKRTDCIVDLLDHFMILAVFSAHAHTCNSTHYLVSVLWWRTCV